MEKIAEKLKAIGAQTKGIKKKIATAAKSKGLKYSKSLQLGGRGKKPGMYFLFDKIVLSKIKEKLGLDCCKFGFSGAAPISTELLSYYGSLGICINEVYGMSECTGATTWSTDTMHEWGSVGFALPSVEIKIFKVDPDNINKKEEVPLADDLNKLTEDNQGEVCFRGRHIMMGYMANPKLGDEHVEEIKKKNENAN